MKSLNKSAKAFIGFLSVSSMVMAGVYSDMKANNLDFMNDNEIQIVERLDALAYDRVVASEKTQMPGTGYLPMKEYASKINGFWEVYRVQNDQEEQMESEEKTVSKFEMIETSKIQINDDKTMSFEVEIYHEEDQMIELVRPFGNGYEKIWAKKIEKTESVEEIVEAPALEENEELVTEENIAQSVDLVLERALNPQMSSNIQTGEKVEGTIVVESDRIEMSDVIVAAGTKEEVSIEGFEARLEAGVFSAEINGETVSGRVSTSGKNAYQLRFETGKNKSLLLFFVTTEEMDRLAEEKELMAEQAAEKSYEDEVTEQEQEEVAQEREVNNTVINTAANEEEMDERYYEGEEENYDSEEEVEYSDEEVMERIADNGMKF